MKIQATLLWVVALATAESLLFSLFPCPPFPCPIPRSLPPARKTRGRDGETESVGLIERGRCIY
jgi:hypothetical protein